MEAKKMLSVMKHFDYGLKSLPFWILYFSTLVRVLKCDVSSEDIIVPQQEEKENKNFCAVGETKRICIPKDYMKYELPTEEGATDVWIGVDIKDIPKVDDKDFSITLNAYFIAKWFDERLEITLRNRTSRNNKQHHQSNHNQYDGLFEKDVNVVNLEPKMSSTTSKPFFTTMKSTEAPVDDDKLTAVNLQILRRLWLPDVEIINLKEFETHQVLTKLEGIWLNKDDNLVYAIATRITFICPMKFNAFPMDIQRCKFLVGSFNYGMEQIVFRNEFVPDEKAAIKSILDYEIDIIDIKPEETHYMALGMNYSVAGFELILTRKMSFYIVTYYLPSGLFVVVSWISFLVNPEVIPGRMTLLVTIFLVLINIFNTIQTNSPKAEGLTAIEAWVIACIIFVFGALGEYTVILLKIKLKKLYPPQKKTRNGHMGQTAQAMANAAASQAMIPLTTRSRLGGRTSPPLRTYTGSFSHHKHHNSNTSRKDNYARTDIIFLIVFPILFTIFNFCYWSALYFWRVQSDTSTPSDDASSVINEEVIGNKVII